MAFTKIVGAGIHTLSNIHSHNVNSSGIITATKFVGPIEGNVTAVDGVFSGNLTVQGTTTTLDTNLIGVDRIEVLTALTNVAVAVTHTGSGDLVRLYDGSSQVVTVDDEGNVTLSKNNPTISLSDSNNNPDYQIGNINGVLRFQDTTNNVTRLGISTIGNVGIGTNDPQTTLHIRQTTDNNTDGFRISRTNSNATYSQFINGVNSSFNIGYSNPSTADPDPQITLLQGGNVGIGSDSPTTTLDVDGTVKATSFSGSGANVTNVNATTLDNIDSTGFLRTNITQTCSGQTTFTNQLIAKQDGVRATQTGVAFVITHATNANLRANHFVVDDFPSGGGSYFIQATEANVSNDRNLVLQGYGGKVKIGGQGTAPTEVLDVNGNVKASNFIGGLPITNGADNRIVTCTSASAIRGETGLTYNGSTFNVDAHTLNFTQSGNVTTDMHATGGDAKIILENSGNGNYSGIDFFRERASGTGVPGGSIFMKSDTVTSKAYLYIQAQSASAQSPVTTALSDNNGVRLILKGVDGIFSVETGSTEKFRINSAGQVKIVNGGFLSVNTDPAATYGVAEALRIDDGGGYQDRGLQIFEYAHSGARYHRIQFNTNTTTNGSAYTYTQGNYGGSSSIEFDNSGHLSFFTNAQVTGGSLDSITPSERLIIKSDGNLQLPSNGQQIHFGASQQFKMYWENSEERMYLQGDGAYGMAFRVNNGNRIEISKTTGDVVMQGASGRNFHWDNSEASLYLTDNGASSARLKIGAGGDLQMYHDAGSSLNLITCANNQELKFSANQFTFYEYTGVTQRFKIDANGNLSHNSAGSGISYFKGSSEYVFGSSTSSPPAGGSEAAFQVHDHKTRATLSLNAYMANAGAPVLQFLSSRSGTKGVLGTKSALNDYLGDIRFVGDNGTNYNSVANGVQILARQKSNISDGDTTCTGELTFYVGSSASPPVLEEKVRIESSGGITLRNTSCNRGLIFVHDGDGGDSCTSMANVQGSGGRGIVETKIYDVAANTTTDLAKSHWGGLVLIGWSGTGHQGTEQVMFGYNRTPTSQYKAEWAGSLTVTYTVSLYTLRISHNASNALNFWCILIGV